MSPLDTEQVLRPDVHEPFSFTQIGLGWQPWLPPLPIEQMTDRHYDGLVEAERAKMPYFALLVREPEILRARTLTDFDVFQNTEGGLPQWERELAATAASRVNGCVFCASVHAKNASRMSERTADVQRLLDEGVSAPVDERWDAIVEAARALTVTPSEFSIEHVRALSDAGLNDLDIADAIAGAAFFNWANRLMLSLGEPTVPPRARAAMEAEAALSAASA
ncbi:alkylhydroperoxidase domain protein [Microbacterium sp. BWT-G7]|uniref:Alkylhydroperoxidase domain protein n=2 Tax=Microbacterium allomyrinae TaxID=2830666 RepID=A0A9X1LTH7_9MICO|nr:alkylhydroperoxidase domain protein [Microbacterium allomyrinae]